MMMLGDDRMIEQTHIQGIPKLDQD
jgi:hypothetical protein